MRKVSDDDVDHVPFSSSKKNKKVSFPEDVSKLVQVNYLPYNEKKLAQKARDGLCYVAGPYSDELWDGDLDTFRDVELTKDEWKQMEALMNKRKSTNTKKSRWFGLGSSTSKIDSVKVKKRATSNNNEDDDTLLNIKKVDMYLVQMMCCRFCCRYSSKLSIGV